MHIETDPSVTAVHAPRRRIPVSKLDKVNEELSRLFDNGTIKPVTQPTDWLSNILVKDNKPAPRSCTVSTPLGLVRRNHAQITKTSTDPVYGYSEPVSIDTDVASDTSEQVHDPSSPNGGGTDQVEQPERHASPEIVLRRSSRNRKLPSRFKDYVMNIS